MYNFITESQTYEESAIAILEPHLEELQESDCRDDLVVARKIERAIKILKSIKEYRRRKCVKELGGVS